MVSEVMKDLGPEIVIETGRGIPVHPAGPVAGAKAFKQAIEATMQAVPLEQAANEHHELRLVMEEWVVSFKGWRCGGFVTATVGGAGRSMRADLQRGNGTHPGTVDEANRRLGRGA